MISKKEESFLDQKKRWEEEHVCIKPTVPIRHNKIAAELCLWKQDLISDDGLASYAIVLCQKDSKVLEIVEEWGNYTIFIKKDHKILAIIKEWETYFESDANAKSYFEEVLLDLWGELLGQLLAKKFFL